jgi:glycine/D-amino acid oxidase-like deaminating enzyme/nitrite reductase/ring-hydroxylating ferredoxin subunit
MIESFHSDTRPIWTADAVIKKQPQQTASVTVDVCIVGAGISGLTAAHLLKRAGKTVAVIDMGRIACGESGHTTGHLTEVFDLSYRDLISRFGLEGAQLAAQSARRSIERIEENIKLLGIDCDFERVAGYQFTEKRGDVDELEDEAEAALRAGVPNEILFETPLPFSTTRAIRFDHQAQFHPLKYLARLAEKIQGDGSYIFEETRMLDVVDGEPCRVSTDRAEIIADDVFVAAHVPSTNRFFLQTKIAAYRTYAIAARVNAEFDRKNLFWDVDRPYHYIREQVLNGASHLIIGGEDHKTGQDAHAAAHFQKLEDWAHERFAVDTITHRWSGQIIESVDGLPYIGLNALSEHVYVATGFSGNGLTFGTIAGILISDLITSNHNPWAELYDASRVKPLAGMRGFLTENIDFPSRLIGDRFTPAQTSDVATIRENEGQIVRVGGKKIAAYRDAEGELHMMSPVCPHLGCYVHWNDAEKSWDCPCHGSRFSCKGQLINGPAVSDLASETYDENAPMIPERYDQPGQVTNPIGPQLISLFSCPLKPR